MAENICGQPNQQSQHLFQHNFDVFLRKTTNKVIFPSLLWNGYS